MNSFKKHTKIVKVCRFLIYCCDNAWCSLHAVRLFSSSNKKGKRERESRRKLELLKEFHMKIVSMTAHKNPSKVTSGSYSMTKRCRGQISAQA
jgi:hypothetical protein